MWSHLGACACRARRPSPRPPTTHARAAPPTPEVKDLPQEDRFEGSACASVVLPSNHISVMPPDAFAGVPRLRSLDLRTNHVESIELDPTATPRLALLSLRSNRLMAIGGIGKLDSLTALDVTANRLVRLDGLEGLSRLRSSRHASDATRHVSCRVSTREISVVRVRGESATA